MVHWRYNPHPWTDAKRCVWDRIGGEDALTLSIGASRFEAYRSTYRAKVKLRGELVVIKVKQARCRYRDNSGRHCRLRIIESHMTGSITPSMVIVDTQPAHWTLNWLLWVLNPKGDSDPRLHRSQFHIGKLNEMDDGRLMSLVEIVVGMKINLFGDVTQAD